MGAFTYADIGGFLLACWFRLTFERRVSCEFEVWCSGDHEADMTPEMVAGLVVLETALGVELMEVAA